MLEATEVVIAAEDDWDPYPRKPRIYEYFISFDSRISREVSKILVQ